MNVELLLEICIGINLVITFFLMKDNYKIDRRLRILEDLEVLQLEIEYAQNKINKIKEW